MKKLSLKKLKLEATDLLQRNELKTVFGGYDGGYGGGSNCATASSCNSTSDMKNGCACTSDSQCCSGDCDGHWISTAKSCKA